MRQVPPYFQRFLQRKNPPLWIIYFISQVMPLMYIRSGGLRGNKKINLHSLGGHAFGALQLYNI